MGTATNSNSGDTADEPQLRVADDALLAQLRARTEPADGGEPLALRLIRFTGADLRGVNLSRAEITGSVFDSADLQGASFVGARIEACSFVAARLPRAVFSDAELSLVNFSHADLEAADFRGAMLDDVDVREADLSSAVFDEGALGTNFLDASLIQGMDVSVLDEFQLDFAQRLALHERGARVQGGYRCPRCVEWYGSTPGLDPTCSLCGATGFVDFDPEIERAKLPVPCPWCSGTGANIIFMGGSGCLYCDGLGRLDAWVIDRSQYSEFVPSDVREYEDEIKFVSMAFADVDLAHAWLEDGHIEDIVFDRCSFRDANFTGALLRDLRFIGCDLTNVAFRRARLEKVTFSECNLAGTDWTDASLEKVQATACDFSHAVISPGQLAAVENTGDSTGSAPSAI